jgi:hypothetical protein
MASKKTPHEAGLFFNLETDSDFPSAPHQAHSNKADSKQCERARLGNGCRRIVISRVVRIVRANAERRKQNFLVGAPEVFVVGGFDRLDFHVHQIPPRTNGMTDAEKMRNLVRR